MGDNTTVEPYWDRVQTGVEPQDRTLTPFGRMLGELGLLDILRSRHIGIRQYSCHSSFYQTLSRIDLAVGNQLACQLTTQVEYLTRTISDHSPLLLRFRLHNSPQGTCKPWKLNPFWLNIIDKDRIQDGLLDYFLHNSGSADRNVKWDAM